MTELLPRIHATMDGLGHLVIACSGGIDSLLLSLVAHRRAPERTIVAHARSPAVPPEATERVRRLAGEEGWDLRMVQSGEFVDENYLANPVDRCYFCKSNLYESLATIGTAFRDRSVLSGANLDDLGEYRPGLQAAAERGVRHPWIEAKFTKADIRQLARELALPFAELPASPCLASRLYTGTRVTPERLRAVHVAENFVKERTGLAVVRCRVREESLLVEVEDGKQDRITVELLSELVRVIQAVSPAITQVVPEVEGYRPGRAFVGAK